MSLVYNLLAIMVLTWQLSSCGGKYTRINSKPDNIMFKYPEEASSERKLEECNQHEACNVIHERFWLPILVERICRCQEGFECPWSLESSNYSMTLNNRSTLKFCEAPKKKTCTRKETAAVVRGRTNDDQTGLIARSIQVNCKCPKTYYWKLQKYTFEDDNSVFQMFRCLKQTMCDRMDFCGYIRADMFSVYYRCTCPEGHLCISNDRDQKNVNEFLYSGPAYKAYCVPWE